MTKKRERTKTAKRSIRRRLPNSVADLPTGVQKSYFMLSEGERAVLNTALEKYRPGQSEPIFVGGHKVFKPALRLMTLYRLAIEEIKDSQAITSYTRWVDAVQVRGAENQEVYLMLSPWFEHIWVESKKRLYWSIWPRSRPLLDCAASTLFACTVGRKTTSRPAPSAFLWNSFERCSGWIRQAMLTEILSGERHYRSGRTSASEPWIRRSVESTPGPTCTSKSSRWSEPRIGGSQR
jgi:hypothetical protein